MKFEIVFKVMGNIRILGNAIELKKNPYSIKLFKKSEEYYISISKTIEKDSKCLPRLSVTNHHKELILPEESSYSDMLEIINHIESFGSLDSKIDSINKVDLTLRWIAESEADQFSPIKEIKRQVGGAPPLEPISEKWLWNTIVHKNQLGELYIPFSFYRDGKNLFYSLRYQSAFCTFYMMLEFFFNEKGWGIANDAYKRKKCLNGSLIKTLENLKRHQVHYDWLTNELKKRGKEYNVEGLLFLLNRCRDELSHAADKKKNRNVFNEHKYFSLSYVAMTICLFVSIKERLLPFVQPGEIDNFLAK